MRAVHLLLAFGATGLGVGALTAGAAPAAAQGAPSVLVSPEAPVMTMRMAMGCLWTLEARGPGASAAVEKAWATVKDLDARLSTYKPDSELSKLNAAAPGRWVPLSETALATLSRARAFAEASGGTFDPTVGPLVSAWGFKDMNYRVPDAKALAAARAATGWRALQLDPAGRRARWRPETPPAGRPHRQVDLGGFAKGTAVDAALTVLKAAGLAAGRVDASGNQARFGSDGAWLALKDPHHEGRELGTIAWPARLAVATSSDAERGFDYDGRRYGHVLDPRTGWPVPAGSAVTVLAPTAEQADALTKPLLVMGHQAGAAWLAKHAPGASARFVWLDAAGKPRQTATPGFPVWEE